MMSPGHEAALRSRRAFPVNGLAQRLADFHWLNLILALAYVIVPAVTVKDTVQVAVVLGIYAVYVLLTQFWFSRRPTTVWSLSVDCWAMIAYITFMMWQTGDKSSALTPLYLIPTVVTAIGHTRSRAVFHVLLICAALLFIQWPDLKGLGIAAIVDISALVIFGFLLIMVMALVGGFRLDTLLASGQLRRLMDRDELTGLLKLEAFNRLAAQLYLRTRRNASSMAVMVIDIQDLNSINDAHGMEAGNEVIRAVAKIAARMIRSTDLAARFGGDEIILLLPRADRVKAAEIGQRIRNGVGQTPLEFGSSTIRAAVNIGVSTYPRDADALSELIQAANLAMHKDRQSRSRSAVG